MTREETTAMLSLLRTAYPTFYSKMSRTELVDTVNLWAEMFEADDLAVVRYALKALIETHTGFPPDIAAVKNKIKEIGRAATDEATDEQLWRRLKESLRNGCYGAEEEFEKLPDVLKRYCGSPSTIRDLSQMDTETLDTVYHGQFLKQIGNVREREQYNRSLTPEARMLFASVYNPIASASALSPAEWNDKRNKVLDALEAGRGAGK